MQLARRPHSRMNALEECWIVLIAPNHQLGHRAQDLDNEVLVSIVNDLILAQLRVEIPGSGSATLRGQRGGQNGKSAVRMCLLRNTIHNDTRRT